MSITLTDVSKAFKGSEVLSGITLTLEDGKCYVLVGESGSGKTTLLRMLAGLEHPDRGVVSLDSKSVSYAFQEPRLFPGLTVRENVLAIAPDRPVDEVLASLHLTEAADKYPHELSGGMKKRAGVARALAAAADVYLLDEPTGGQDEMHIEMVAEAIRRYTADAVVIVATHDDKLRSLLFASVLRVHNGTCTLA